MDQQGKEDARPEEEFISKLPLQQANPKRRDAPHSKRFANH